jgi:hypothetical protein
VPLKTSLPTLQELADLCLQHLVRNPDQLAEFMVQSGLEPKRLRGLVGTDGFAHGLVDYVASNEPLLLAVAAEARLAPETIMQAWARIHQAEQ